MFLNFKKKCLRNGIFETIYKKMYINLNLKLITEKLNLKLCDCEKINNGDRIYKERYSNMKIFKKGKTG